jgi:hypothetical protein
MVTPICNTRNRDNDLVYGRMVVAWSGCAQPRSLVDELEQQRTSSRRSVTPSMVKASADGEGFGGPRTDRMFSNRSPNSCSFASGQSDGEPETIEQVAHRQIEEGLGYLIHSVCALVPAFALDVPTGCSCGQITRGGGFMLGYRMMGVTSPATIRWRPCGVSSSRAPSRSNPAKWPATGFPAEVARMAAPIG